MKEKHPGGIAMTKHLLSLARLERSADNSISKAAPACSLSPCRILDMGVGNGQSVHLLLDMGFDAVGIDLHPLHPDLLTVSADLSDTEYLISDHSDRNISQTRSWTKRLLQGDFLHCPFADQSFDAILSECSFYVSGHPRAALSEAARLLKKGGTLLLADVSPLSGEAHIQSMQDAGFAVKYTEDITPLWKEYYLSCIWDGTADELCRCTAPDLTQDQESSFSFFKKKFSYYLTICERM